LAPNEPHALLLAEFSLLIRQVTATAAARFGAANNGMDGPAPFLFRVFNFLLVGID
jgi:hypothetical protein